MPTLSTSLAIVVIFGVYLWFLSRALGSRLGTLVLVTVTAVTGVLLSGMTALEALIGEKGLLVGFIFALFTVLTASVAYVAYTRHREKRILRQLYTTPTNPTGDQRLYLAELTGVAPEAVNLSDPEENRFTPSRDAAWRIVYASVPIGAAYLVGHFFYPHSSWNATFRLAVLTYFAVAVSYGIGMALWYWRFIRSGGVDYIDPHAPSQAKPTLTLVHDARRAPDKHQNG